MRLVFFSTKVWPLSRHQTGLQASVNTGCAPLPQPHLCMPCIDDARRPNEVLMHRFHHSAHAFLRPHNLSMPKL